MQEVLNIVTDNLTNERLDKIIQKNNHYLEVMKRVHTALLELEKINSDTKDVKALLTNMIQWCMKKPLYTQD